MGVKAYYKPSPLSIVRPNLIISKHLAMLTNDYLNKQKANYLYEIIRPKSKMVKTKINRILFSLKGKIAINRQLLHVEPINCIVILYIFWL